jgi:isopenicillin N synthase-like dioxygenase
VRSLPVIDLAPLRAGNDSAARRVAQEIDTACREVGFFYVVGHGVDPSLLSRLDQASRGFFALDDEEKAEIAMERAGTAWRGWFPLDGELTSGVPDHKEGLYFGAELGPDDPRVRAGTPLHGPNLFPRRPPELRAAVLDVMGAMTGLGQLVLSGMALGLGLERSWFVDHLTADPLVLFRIFHYPPTDPAGPAGPEDGARWGVAEHTDYGLLTVLAQDDSGGLQVRTPQGWIDARPIEDAFVCNIGDMLERLTGGLYLSTTHRVRNEGHADRLSFPFFLDPGWSAVVDRLPIVERPPGDGGAARRWDRTSVHGFTGTYGDYLTSKVAKVFPALGSSLRWQPPSTPTAPGNEGRHRN